MVQCPYNSNEFCVSETIMIDGSGRCFDIVRGFSQERIEQVKGMTKAFTFEDVELDAQSGQTSEDPIEEQIEVKDEEQLENQEEHD